MAVLEKLAHDSSVDRYGCAVVRISVAENPNTPAALLERLAGDAGVNRHGLGSVRSSVAENPGTPVAVLECLAFDPDSFVRASVAGNPSTPAAVLEKLACGLDDNVRSRIAGNPCTPPAMLERLAQDQSDRVREQVVRNINTPAAVQEMLSNEPSVRGRLFSDRAWRPIAFGTPEWKERVLQCMRRSLDRLQQERNGSVPDPLLSPPMLEASDLLRALDWLGCVSDGADNKELTKASRSKDWLTRLAVALHRKASAGQLELLAKDGHLDVATAARQRVHA